MTQVETLALYAGAILIGALVGGALPLLGRMRRSDALLSFSAGVMLGAAFFHMLPEAAEGAGIVEVARDLGTTPASLRVWMEQVSARSLKSPQVRG